MSRLTDNLHTMLHWNNVCFFGRKIRRIRVFRAAGQTLGSAAVRVKVTKKHTFINFLRYFQSNTHFVSQLSTNHHLIIDQRRMSYNEPCVFYFIWQRVYIRCELGLKSFCSIGLFSTNSSVFKFQPESFRPGFWTLRHPAPSKNHT